jgi:hypothetical protein
VIRAQDERHEERREHGRWAGVAMRERSESGPRVESKQRNGGATPQVSGTIWRQLVPSGPTGAGSVLVTAFPHPALLLGFLGSVPCSFALLHRI